MARYSHDPGLVNHDIVVIGGSAGAVDVMLEMVSELPRNLAASIFVVVHVHPTSPSSFPELLSRRGPIPAHHPIHGEKIAPSRIYVAPPDMQLLVRNGYVEVIRGPRENGHRPAVDALFRTAAAAYGPRVIGVVLSGYLDCGTAGMMSIKARGGIAVAQSPDSAIARDMPEHVIERLPVDHVVDPLELPGLLAKLVPTPAPEPLEIASAVRQLEGDRPGDAAELVCPTCQGVLTEAQAGAVQQFRCHVGHTFSMESLLKEQSEELERALWAAVRALEESAAISRRMGATAGGRFEEKARTQRDEAEIIRHILLHGEMLTPSDAPKAG
ncbi:MAG TPA: chemotaxis protein CheB [Polyangiaceae bacterium]